MSKRRKLDRSRVPPLSVDDAAALSLLAPRRFASWSDRMRGRLAEAAPLPGVEPVNLGALARSLLSTIPAVMVNPTARACLEMFAMLGETRRHQVPILKAWFHLAGVAQRELTAEGWKRHATVHRSRMDAEARRTGSPGRRREQRRRKRRREAPRAEATSEPGAAPG